MFKSFIKTVLTVSLAFTITLVVASVVTNNNVSTTTSVMDTPTKVDLLPLVNLKEDLNKKQKLISNLELSESQIVPILGEIDSLTSLPVEKQILKLGKGKKPIYILIDSPGGSVLDGAQIISAMEASKAPVYTVCMQLCASMAAIIHQYGTQRYMVDRSLLMFHPASGSLQGTMEQMQSRLGTINKYINKMDAYIAKRANLSPEKFASLFVSEYWIDAEDALGQGFADKLVSVTLDDSLNLLSKQPESDKHRKAKQKINLTW